MKHIPLSTILALAVFVPMGLVTSCSDDDDPPRPPTPPPDAAPIDAAPAPDAAPSDAGETLRDSQIVQVLMTANAGEVTQATVARAKSTNAAVRSFATMMVDDHGGANRRLETLMTRENIAPEQSSVSRTLKSESDAIVSQLQSLTGNAFDLGYMESQVAVHTKVLTLIDDVLIPSVDNAALRAELTATRAAVASHLEHAREIRSELLTDGGTEGGTGTQ